MSLFPRMIILFFALSLFGCTPAPNSEQAACIKTCKVKTQSCKQNCTNNCKSCSNCAGVETATSYAKYHHQQCVKGGRIARDLQSYRDPLKCRKTTCNCHADYKVCVQNCTGVIHKRLQVPPTCC